MYIRPLHPSEPTSARSANVRATISKWGNSLGLRIPRGLAEDAGLGEGSIVELRLENGNVIAEPVTVESLESLLTKVSAKNLHSEVWVGSQRGREIW
jgi:antitoxin MazE